MKRILSVLLLALIVVSACSPSSFPEEPPPFKVAFSPTATMLSTTVDQLHAINLALRVEARYTRIPQDIWSPITIEEVALTNHADTGWGLSQGMPDDRLVWVVKISGRWSDPHPPQEGQDVELHFLVVVVDAEKGDMIGYGMFVEPPSGR